MHFSAGKKLSYIHHMLIFVVLKINISNQVYLTFDLGKFKKKSFVLGVSLFGALLCFFGGFLGVASLGFWFFFFVETDTHQ